jgi:hypothetical protein
MTREASWVKTTYGVLTIAPERKGQHDVTYRRAKAYLSQRSAYIGDLMLVQAKIPGPWLKF